MSKLSVAETLSLQFARRNAVAKPLPVSLLTSQRKHGTVHSQESHCVIFYEKEKLPSSTSSRGRYPVGVLCLGEALEQ